jgi:transcriptional regulator with XRE-family HTH domain
MHRTYLADVERGARNLSLSSMARLVTGIGVSLSQFFATLESIELAPTGQTRVSGPTTSRARKTAALARAARRKR